MQSIHLNEIISDQPIFVQITASALHSMLSMRCPMISGGFLHPCSIPIHLRPDRVALTRKQMANGHASSSFLSSYSHSCSTTSMSVNLVGQARVFIPWRMKNSCTGSEWWAGVRPLSDRYKDAIMDNVQWSTYPSNTVHRLCQSTIPIDRVRPT